MTKQLVEALTEAPVRRGNRWRVIVARPGQGSSGFYSEDLFRRDADKVVPAGGQSFINHESSRNPKDMIGVYPEGSFWSEEDNAVVAELEVFSHWADFVEEVGPHCGISLYAMGEQDAEGNITAIVEDRMNGADLVARPGLVGSGIAEKLYESAVAASEEKPETTVVKEQMNGDGMDKKLNELGIKLDKLIDMMSALVADENDAMDMQAQMAAAEAAAEQRVEAFAAAVKAVDEAALFESQREVILEAAKRGEDISSLVESAIKVKEEALTAAAATVVVEEAVEGRIVTESATSYGAWA